MVVALGLLGVIGLVVLLIGAIQLFEALDKQNPYRSEAWLVAGICATVGTTCISLVLWQVA
ncbi:hypothetical protein [Pararhizobium sp.]|uniref:hypothetical protein n=1 Tax=Pararhizobium sp. TaxID=1977563 RepID=UPI003D09C1CF